MDKIVELAELFKERENIGYTPYTGTVVEQGKIRIKPNVVLTRFRSCVDFEIGDEVLVLPIGRTFIVAGVIR